MTSMTNGHSDPKSLLRDDIEMRRRGIEHHLTALEGQFSPRQVFERALESLQGSGAGDFGKNLSRSVSENPLPVLLTTAGIGWLIASSRGTPGGGPSLSESRGAMQQARAGASERFEQARLGAGRKSSEARGAASRAAGSVRDKASSVAGGVRSGARRASDRMGEARYEAGNQAHKAADRASYEFDQRPLVGVLAAFGVGALFGALVPNTRRENELAGPYRDNLFGRARDYGEDVVERGERVARAAMESGKSEARSDHHQDSGERTAEALKSAIDEAHASSRREVSDFDGPSSR